MPEETGVGTIVKIALVILVIVMSIFALKYARELLSPFLVTPESEAEENKKETQFVAFTEKLIEDVDVSCDEKEICTLTIKFTKKRRELLKSTEETLIIKVNSREELKIGNEGSIPLSVYSGLISGQIMIYTIKKSAKFEVEVTKIKDEKIIAWDKVVVDGIGKTLVPELIWPLDTAFLKLSSCYGERILDGKKDFHDGINIEVLEGTVIVASSSGFVVKTCEGSTGKCGEFGNNILMQHANNLYTRYSRLSHIDIFDKEKPVSKGQRIGKSGSSLDFKIYKSATDVSGSKTGKNPLCFFPEDVRKKLILPEGCKLPSKEECIKII